MKTLRSLFMIGGFVALAIILCSGPISQVAGAKKEVHLTSNVVAWVSSQSEKIIQELEAIVQQNAQTLKFNLVNYLRYLFLFNKLKVVASQKAKDLEWVRAKAHAFEKVYDHVEDVVYEYLEVIESKLSDLESKESKSVQKGIGYSWRQLYEAIDYIVHYSPDNSKLQKYGLELLQKSPNGTADKRRSTRYDIATKGGNRR